MLFFDDIKNLYHQITKEVRETPQYLIQLASRLFLKLPFYSEE